MSATQSVAGIVDDLVEILMRECNCTEERAITLLKIFNNDVADAKRHHEVFQIYAQDLQETPSSHSTSVWSVVGRSRRMFRTPSRSRSNTPPPHNVSPGKEGQDDDETCQREWDFILPRLPLPENLTDYGFSPDALAGAIQHGFTAHHSRSYLHLYDSSFVEQHINDSVMGFPLIFYAVAANDENMVRLLIEFGANACTVHEPSQVPLLAFAIICGETLQTDTTIMVCTLLSQGASPRTIPIDLFMPYIQDTTVRSGQKGKEEIGEGEATAWCSQVTKTRLAKAINLTQRYFLERSLKLKPPSLKRRQIARLKNCQGLLGIPYFLVGQSVATELLIQRLLTHLMMPTNHPLVLCFAGPSGHGKTELARQLGHLLSLDLEVVDCTIMNHEMELFGPRRPYSGYEKGSAVNNFLVENSGKRCIVFLDEFEKTTRDIHQTLLLPFDNGEYQDRRNGDKIDCSNTIWIVATNALDNTILDFYQQNDALAGDEQTERSRLVRKLSQQLREGFLQYFGAPVTGRVSEFVPFLPFSVGEQAVITHKYLLELAQDLRLPISLFKGPQERLIGNIRLLIKRDSTVCSILGQAHYHNKLGARSLKAGAQTVKRIVLDAYLDDDEEIREHDDLCDFVVDVDDGDIVGRIVKDMANSRTSA